MLLYWIQSVSNSCYVISCPLTIYKLIWLETTDFIVRIQSMIWISKKTEWHQESMLFAERYSLSTLGQLELWNS